MDTRGLPANAAQGGALIALGVLLVSAALIVRWSVGSRRRRSADPLRDVQTQVREIEQSPAGAALRLEVRLHDLARETEGRLQSRIALLEHLLSDADSRIARLEALLASDGSTDAQARLPSGLAAVEASSRLATGSAKRDSDTDQPASDEPFQV